MIGLRAALALVGVAACAPPLVDEVRKSTSADGAAADASADDASAGDAWTDDARTDDAAADHTRTPEVPETEDLPDGGPCPPPRTGDLMLGAGESSEGYDEELAGLDLEGLPARLELDSVPALERALIAYMLETDTLEAVDRDAALRTRLGRAVLGAFAMAVPGSGVDGAFLRRGLHRYYACVRGLPPTLDDFRRAVHDFTVDPIDEVVDSDVKGLARRIRRNVLYDMFVAETLRPDGSVRETEILLTGQRADSNLEFLEYDSAGSLSGASMFLTAAGADVVGAVPTSCIGCHGTRDVVPPR